MSDEERPVLNYQTPGTGARDWKTVWKARNNFEANLAVAKLQERGLHARVEGENVGTMAPHLSIAAPPAVQVMDDEVAEARAILAEIDAERIKRQQAGSMHCPTCGAPNAKRRTPLIRHVGTALLALTVLFAGLDFGAPIVVLAPAMVFLWLWPVTPRWWCLHCGNKWAAPAPAENEEDED
jgi:hypothetical protein